jgi:deoxyribodipyrimidine photo-lyase
MTYTLFIFRRDLRIRDNNALKYAINKFDNIVPIFIFTPEQITSQNKFRSDNAIQFMIESLKELNKNLDNKLVFQYGDNIDVLKSICRKIKVIRIIFNVDYTKYARQRDGKIMKLCKSLDIECLIVEDYLLSKMGTYNKDNGDPYLVFTPFKNNAMKTIVKKPSIYKIKGIIGTTKLDKYDIDKIKYSPNDNVYVHGGRTNAIKQLNKIGITQKKYNDNRDQLKTETTLLSAYIKFGCLSIREVYWKFRTKLGPSTLLISQLFWREFYYYTVFYKPDLLSPSRINFRDTFQDIKWTNNKKHFEAWCDGNTGFPVVDAGMRQLNKTGYMHNRARLITANFLNRILNIDWRWGEMYYASKLVDYDPAINNGNWQWVASTGVDTAQYFQRVFNPTLQSKRYDPDNEYINEWVDKDENIKPIVSYSYGRTRSLKVYKSAFQN